jgi:hypothetical protein
MQTQDAGHRIQVNVRTWHSDGCSKSFNAYILPVEAEFYIVSSAGEVMARFRKSFGTFDCRAFDPFAEAGLSGSYTDYYLLLHM